MDRLQLGKENKYREIRNEAGIASGSRGANSWRGRVGRRHGTPSHYRDQGTDGRSAAFSRLAPCLIRSDLAGGGVQTAKHTEKTKSGRARASNMVTMVHRLRRRSGR